MKKGILLTSLILSIGFSPLHAQVRTWGDLHVSRFMTDAPKDPRYAKFQERLNGLLAKANGTNTNADAVRSLYLENRTLLQSLYTRSGLQESKAMRGGITRRSSLVHAKPDLFISASGKYKKVRLTATKLPPYDGVWRRSEFPNANMSPLPFDTTGSIYNSGKLVITSNPCHLPPYCYVGFHSLGYTETIEVPSNPKILGAQIKFDYSFNYTGWDSYGAKTGIDLIMRAPENFNSTAFNQLADVTASPYTPPATRWKHIGVLMPLDSVTTDFDEFHASGNGTYTIEGYITPGSNIEFRFGFAFPKGTNKGLTGCYHYGEFRLKKISVTYFTSSN